MLLDGEKTSISELISKVKKLQSSGYFVSMGVSEINGNVLISASKIGKVVDRKSFLVSELTVSTRSRLLDLTHAWDFMHTESARLKREKLVSKGLLNQIR